MQGLKRCGALPRWSMAFAGVMLAASAAHADLVVDAGATTDWFDSDLSCTDVIVHGTLNMQGGNLSNVRNVVIGAGGAINMGGGSITLAGNWTNGGGSFAAGGGNVGFVDNVGCATAPTSGTVSGNTAFDKLSIVSSTGKLYTFADGSAQTVATALTLTGTAGTPLKIESSTPGSPSADINLANGGTQSLANLAVRGMKASGQWLAPGQTNQGAGPVSRWFGDPYASATPVPTTSQWTLLLIALALIGLAARTHRNTQSPAKNTKD